MISFKYRHFDKAIILTAVRWYVAYSLSYRDIEELFLERNITVDHSTINRWVVKYSPQLLMIFKKIKRQIGNNWKADKTYVKVKSEWFYQYRAVDKDGKTIDVYFSKNVIKLQQNDFSKKRLVHQGSLKK